MSKTDDDPDRVRPPQRGNDEWRIGQEKNTFQKIFFSESIKVTFMNDVMQVGWKEGSHFGDLCMKM